MAINYTYPIKAVPTVSDNVLIIDNEDTTNPRATKTATIQSIVNLASGGGGGGDVTGPASSVDRSIPVFDGTSGKIIRDGTGVTINANGNVTLDNWPNTDAEFRGDVDGAIRFTAQADENLSFGDAVYISGASGANTLVRKAQSNSLSTMPAFGFAYKDATSGNPVQVVTFGNIYGSGGAKPLDTTVDSDGNSITVGDTLYVSPTTLGGWTNVRPTGATELVQNIGKVTRVNPNNGSIKAGGAGRVNDTSNTISITGSISGSQVLSQKFTTFEVGVTGVGLSPTTFTYDVDAGSVALITIKEVGGNILELKNLPAATPIIVKVLQEGTGAPWPDITDYIDTGGGTVEWSGGTAPTITQINNKYDILTFVRIGANVYASINQNFS